MLMKLIEKVMKAANLDTSYKLAKLLNIPTQVVDRWRGKVKKGAPPGGMQFKYLCHLRRISGKTWVEFGKWLDEEFFEKGKHKFGDDI